MGQGGSSAAESAFEDINYFDDGSMLEPEWWSSDENVEVQSKHSQPEHSKKAAISRIEPDLGRHYGPGIIWISKNDKLIVAGFPEGSVAKRVGVVLGDILKGVDDRDVLHLKTYANGKHPAGDMMLGTYGEHCKMEFLRIGNAPQPQQPPPFHAVTCVVPRIVAVPSPTA